MVSSFSQSGKFGNARPITLTGQTPKRERCGNSLFEAAKPVPQRLKIRIVERRMWQLRIKLNSAAIESSPPRGGRSRSRGMRD
jgi:hypothetical protein